MVAAALFLVCWSATRAVGFVSYAATSVFCASVWLWARRGVPSQMKAARLALVPALIELILSLDMVFEWRFALRFFLEGVFMKHDLYGRRHPYQASALLAVGLILILALVAALRCLRARKGALLAVSGISMSLALWLIEVISMHEVDGVLYRMVDGIMVIAPLWALACALTLAGAGAEAWVAASRDAKRKTL